MSIRQFLLAAGLALAGLPAAAQAPAAALSLAQTLQAARDNLEVALARHALRGAQADIVAADRAPLPVLTAKLGQMDAQNGIGDGHLLIDKRVDKSVGLDWTWERGNKRELRTLAARRVADAAQAELEEMRVQQQLGALAGFYDLLAAQLRIQEVAQIERGAAELAVSARKRLDAGDLSAQEVARIEIEARRAQAELRQAELEHQRAALALWQVTGVREAPDRLRVRDEWPALPDGPPAAADLESLLELRPDVRAAQARLQAAQAVLDGSGALQRADITWGASYDHYPGTSTALWELRMQMPLQWGYNYQGEIARAGAQLAQAQDALERARRQARAELRRLQEEMWRAGERARAYAVDILPRARQVAASAELAYAKGALSLTDLLDARRTLRTTALDALAARADYAKTGGAWQLRVQAAAEQRP